MLYCQFKIKRLKITIPNKLHCIYSKCAFPLSHANEQFGVLKQVTWPSSLEKLMYIPKYQFT